MTNKRDRNDRRVLEGPGRCWTTTVMTPDATLELSLEQLISALDKKLFGECARIRSTIPLAPRTMAAAFTAQVRFRERKGNPRMLIMYFTGQFPRESSQRSFTPSPFSEEFNTTRELSSPCGPRVLRHFRLRCRPAANRPLDPRLSVLARIHRFQPRELEVNRDGMEKACPFVPWTCRSTPPGYGHCGVG